MVVDSVHKYDKIVPGTAWYVSSKSTQLERPYVTLYRGCIDSKVVTEVPSGSRALVLARPTDALWRAFVTVGGAIGWMSLGYEGGIEWW